MTKMWLLVLGALAIMTAAITVLVLVPKALLNKVKPPPGLNDYKRDEALGRAVYISEGCVYCHSQQVRDRLFTTDQERGWGRPNVPADYVYDAPHLLGTMRTGPDLINVGARLPDPQWHLLHLYQPRALVPWSIMPSYPYLFEIKLRQTVLPAETLQVPAPYSPREGYIVVPKQEARYLVSYLLSLKRDYPIPDTQTAER